MADLVTEWFMEPSVRTNYRTMVYYKGDGQDTFEINFDGGFIYKEDVKAFSVKDDTRERKNHKVTFVNGSVSRVKLDSVIPKGRTVCIYRDTPKAKPLAQFTDGAIINEANLDRNAQQAMFAVSEMVDRFDSTVESVEAALQQVYKANKKADQAINTANGAKATADNAVRIANGTVTTAKEAKQAAANANTTAGNAVKTANEAKSIALGLDGQIKQANTTANNAVKKADSAIATANKSKSTANGIDAKATKALTDSAQALKVANGINAKATQALNNSKEALDKANAALESQGIAKQLTDRVSSFQGTTTVNWAGQHNFLVNVQLRGLDATKVTTLQYHEVADQFRIFKSNTFSLFVGSDTFEYNGNEVYYAGLRNPYFTSSVIARNYGYYSKFTMLNSTNNDRVELLQSRTNLPYLESRSGSTGSVSSRWDFPNEGGIVLTDRYFDRFKQHQQETIISSPSGGRFITVKNGLVGCFDSSASRWLFAHAGNVLSLYGTDDRTGLELKRGNGTSMHIESNPEFLSVIQRNANGSNNGVVTFPKPKGSSDSIVYNSMVYGKSETYRKDEVYNKSESDGRYKKKGVGQSIRQVWKGESFGAGGTVNLTEDIRGKTVYIKTNIIGYLGVGIMPVKDGLPIAINWWREFHIMGTRDNGKTAYCVATSYDINEIWVQD